MASACSRRTGTSETCRPHRHAPRSFRKVAPCTRSFWRTHHRPTGGTVGSPLIRSRGFLGFPSSRPLQLFRLVFRGESLPAAWIACVGDLLFDCGSSQAVDPWRGSVVSIVCYRTFSDRFSSRGVPWCGSVADVDSEALCHLRSKTRFQYRPQRDESPRCRFRRSWCLSVPPLLRPSTDTEARTDRRPIQSRLVSVLGPKAS